MVSNIFSKIQLVPHRIQNWVVPNYLSKLQLVGHTGYQIGWSPNVFRISFGTGYQIGWVVHFIFQIQIVPIFWQWVGTQTPLKSNKSIRGNYGMSLSKFSILKKAAAASYAMSGQAELMLPIPPCCIMSIAQRLLYCIGVLGIALTLN